MTANRCARVTCMRRLGSLALIAALAGCGNGEPAPAASDAATVPTVAPSMPATTSDPAATALLRQFDGRDANRDGFIATAENGAAEARIFEAIDGDSDGTMSVAELDAARVALGLVTLPGSEALISDADQDGDRKLTLAEWIAGQDQAFAAADRNGDERLDRAEYDARPRLERPTDPAGSPTAAGAGAG